MTSERDPNWASAQGIGDVKSDEKGSGARFNNGKPAMELLPLRAVATLLTGDQGGPSGETICLAYLAAFQEGCDTAIFDAMAALGDPQETLVECAQVFDYGKRKYAEWNWAKGMNWSIPIACATRHLMAMLRDEWIDPVEEKGSGLPHRGHVMCNLMMLATYLYNYREGDDRPVKWLNAGQTKKGAAIGPEIAKAAADRFCAWQLPQAFYPDGGISFTPPSNPNWWPTGTNLLSHEQARQMFEHCLGVPSKLIDPKHADTNEA